MTFRLISLGGSFGVDGGIDDVNIVGRDDGQTRVETDFCIIKDVYECYSSSTALSYGI